MDTRELIITVAEDLFIEQGYADSSLRQITQKAGVNLAAVNYHFGSKEILLAEILKGHLSALNQERLEALTQLRQAAQARQGQTIRPSLIMEAFFGTVFKRARDNPRGAVFLRLLGRVHTSPHDFIRVLFAGEHTQVLEAYLTELYRALPQVNKAEILWRMDFMVGAMAYAIAGTDTLRLISNWNNESSETRAEEWDRLYERIMSFLMGGFRAPLPVHK